MFYERFKALCDKKGVTPSRAAIEAGVSKSLVSKWKANESKEPSPEVVRKLAEYFGISAFEVLEDLPQKEKPLVNGDEELTEYLEELRTRPEMKMLFQLTKDATKEDVEKAVRVIETMLGK